MSLLRTPVPLLEKVENPDIGMPGGGVISAFEIPAKRVLLFLVF